MNYLKVLTCVISLPLSLSLSGCVTTSTQRTDSLYTQSMTRAQIQQVQVNQQMKVKQKQKIVQNNHQSNTVYVNQPSSQPHRANVRQSYDSFATSVFTPQPRKKDHGYQEDDLNRQRTETAQIEQAKINSYNTYEQDNVRRQQRAAEEERQMEQARKNSLDTYSQEESRRQKNAAEEAQNARRAQEDSLFAAAQQQAHQHDQQRAQEQASQAAAKQQSDQQAAAEEARQMAQAVEDSKRTHAEEEARRQQQAPKSSVYDVPPVQPTFSPDASAPPMDATMSAPVAG